MKTENFTGDFFKLFQAAKNRLNKGTLVLVRGLPGSGKSYLARELHKLTDAELPPVAADDYFMEDGEYKFDASKLPEAHLECQSNCFAYFSIDDIAFVANTFTQRWEMEPYIRFVETFGLDLLVLNLFDEGLSNEELAGRNTHGVPAEAITRMRERFETNWLSGAPRPPWERG